LEGKILDQFSTFVLDLIVTLWTAALTLCGDQLLAECVTDTLATEGMSTVGVGNCHGRSKVVTTNFAPQRFIEPVQEGGDVIITFAE
jgi:hypothetical protein